MADVSKDSASLSHQRVFTDTAGKFSPGVGMIDECGDLMGTPSNPLSTAPGAGPALDAFGRLRVSEPLTLFDSKQIYDNQPLFWDESLETGAGITSAHDPNTASTVITSTVSTAGKFTRQTFQRFNYQPGKSQYILMTGILGRSGGGAGVTCSLGYFDDDNGLFFSQIASAVNVVRRSNVTGTPVDTAVAQTAWNVDKMDGTGPSGVTLDWSKTQIFGIDFEWLGVGTVRFYIVVNGVPCIVHQSQHANVLDKVYMSTPNLPCRFQLETTGSSVASTMECICATVISEGGVSDLGVIRYASTAGTHVDANSDGTIYAIFGIRLKSTHLGAEVTFLNSTIAETAGNNNLEWMVILNPTVASTFTYSDETDSCMQSAPGATANTVTGGHMMGGGHFSSGTKGGANGNTMDSARRLGAAIDGTRDTMVLCVRPIGSSNTDIEGGLTWREVP